MSSFTLKRLLVYSVGKMRLICSILTKKEKKKRKLRVAGTGIQKQCVKNGEECLHEQKVHSEWADVVCFFWFSFLCPISMSWLAFRGCFQVRVFHRMEYV